MLPASCSVRLYLQRLLLALLLLSALPAVAVQNVQGILASQEQSLDAALTRTVLPGRDEAGSDPVADPLVLSASAVFSFVISHGQRLARVSADAVPRSASRRLPPAQAPPFA